MVTNAADPFDSPEQGITGEVVHRIDGTHHPQLIAESMSLKGAFDTRHVGPKPAPATKFPGTGLRCHLHIALPGLHLILRHQPAFANNVAFDTWQERPWRRGT